MNDIVFFNGLVLGLSGGVILGVISLVLFYYSIMNNYRKLIKDGKLIEVK